MSPLDFSVEELDQLMDLANDIEKHPEKYAHACGRRIGRRKTKNSTAKIHHGSFKAETGACAWLIK